MKASKLVTRQVKEFRKELANGDVLIAHVRFDDECGNGHNTFAITCDVFDRDRTPGERSVVNAKGKRRYLGAVGCQHDLVTEHFPELAPAINWHLCSTDGPMHYIANTVYFAERGELDNARASAVAPTASLKELSDRVWLETRLEKLLQDFCAAVENLGFEW